MTLSFSFASGQNTIVPENQLTGNSSSESDVSAAKDLTIQGFATDISVDKGDTVHFTIKAGGDVNSTDISRLGYYQVNGARKVETGVGARRLPQTQSAEAYDSETGRTNCGNRLDSAHRDVPASVVSGIYVAKLTSDDISGASTLQRSWGVDGKRNRGSMTPDTTMQQATVRMHSRMGAQPTTLRSGLIATTASSDLQAPLTVPASSCPSPITTPSLRSTHLTAVVLAQTEGDTTIE